MGGRNFTGVMAKNLHQDRRLSITFKGVLRHTGVFNPSLNRLSNTLNWKKHIEIGHPLF
jgi:hypothetical protein